MAEREAAGDFDYLIGEGAEAPAETDVSDVDALPEPAPPDESDTALPARNGAFDAFDSNTWYFEPAPSPWYRRKQALTALIAAATAAATLVIAVVLLVFRSPGSAEDTITSVESTASTTVVSTELATSRQPPPPRTTEAPEIGLTRTPVPRPPISVAPQRPGSP